MSKNGPDDTAPGDEAPPQEPLASPDVCPRYGGTGELDGPRCDEHILPRRRRLMATSVS